MSPDHASSTPAATTFRNARFTGQADLAAVIAGQATLTLHARGPGVKAVQQALIDMGFSLPGGADGLFGKQSAKAVRNFQVHARSAFPAVQPTGAVDRHTLHALDVLAPAPKQHGQQGHLPTPRYGQQPVRVVVVKDEHRTFLFNAQGQCQAIFGNAVGAKATRTDTGLKKVKQKLGLKAARELGFKLWGGPVFGARLIDLSWADNSRSGEELHGTNAPSKLGEDVSHGCIRHENAAIIELYNALQVGDWVAVVDSVSDPHLGPPSPVPGVTPVA